jgi:hypothetical protein
MATDTITIEEQKRAIGIDDPRGYAVTDEIGLVTVRACLRCYRAGVTRSGFRHGFGRCRCCAEILAPFKCEVCGTDA